MSDHEQGKIQAIRLIRLLEVYLAHDHPAIPRLRKIIREVKQGKTPPPAQKKDWSGLCKKAGLNPADLPHEKILSHFSADDIKIYKKAQKKAEGRQPSPSKKGK